jgi:hypothetical protein
MIVNTQNGSKWRVNLTSKTWDYISGPPLNIPTSGTFDVVKGLAIGQTMNLVGAFTIVTDLVVSITKE